VNAIPAIATAIQTTTSVLPAAIPSSMRYISSTGMATVDPAFSELIPKRRPILPRYLRAYARNRFVVPGVICLLAADASCSGGPIMGPGPPIMATAASSPSLS
jgi:hypothetical protein